MDDNGDDQSASFSGNSGFGERRFVMYDQVVQLRIHETIGKHTIIHTYFDTSKIERKRAIVILIHGCVVMCDG
jgi:NADH:ubiquinone oxidoreductase subunit